MESGDEDQENIFEEYENTENDREAGNEEGANETSGVKVPVPKRIVKNPRLKFNPERLCGERGIPILADHFKDLKYQGVGHEKEDLDKLLTKLEHWTHRLFPSMTFEDCLHHIEKLGKKRPVQTCLRKLRQDMPILSSDFVNNDEDNVRRVEDSEPVEMDAFDRLVEESQATLNSTSVNSTENIMDSNPVQSSPVQSSYPAGQVLGSTLGSSLTEEQRERMERNRMLAAERRKARLAALQENPIDTRSGNEETISQSTSSSPKKSFDSLFIAEELPKPVNIASDKLDVAEAFPALDNENSEKLGLDDLMDLVDEDSSTKFNDDKKLNMGEGSKINDENSEELGLEDLMDLVEEDSSTKFNDDEKLNVGEGSSELNDHNSKEVGKDHLIDLVDENSSTKFNDSKLLSTKEGSKLNNHNSPKLDDLTDLVDKHSLVKNNAEEKLIMEENSFGLKTPNLESLGLDNLMDLVDEEPVSKNAASVSSDESKTVSGNVDKTNEFSPVSQIISPNFEDNVNANLSNNINSEGVTLDKVSKDENEEDLEIESLMDLVNEESEDIEAISDGKLFC